MTALVEEHTARQRRCHERIQEEHGALTASLETAAAAHAERAEKKAEQERRRLRQESAALANTFESIEGAVARESAREAALMVDMAGAEATVKQTKA